MEFTNITKLAEYWGVSRTMIYEKINSWKLNRQQGGAISAADMYQVFGKPKQKPNNPNIIPTDRNEQNRTSADLQQEILILREKLDFKRTLREHSEQQTAEL